MNPLLFLKGILIGFAMAIPIGPIGIMCIRMSLSESRVRGFTVGLGAATADMLYASVAAFGLTVISTMLETQRIAIRFTGGILLLIVGIQVYNAHLVRKNYPDKIDSMLKLYLYTIILTLTNPFTIFAFIAVLALLGLADVKGMWNASFLVLGVFVGSGAWFFLLSAGASMFKSKLDNKRLRLANKIAGVFIFISGAIALASLL